MPKLPGYVDDGNEYQIPVEKQETGFDLGTELSGLAGATRAGIELGGAFLVDRFALGGQDVPDLPRMTQAEALERQKADGVTFAVPSIGMTEFEWNYRAEKARTLKDAEERAAKASAMTQFVGTAIGSAITPDILMPVPGLNNAANRLLLKTAKIASRTGRIAARAAVRAGQGAVEGAAGTVVTAPIIAEGMQKAGREYGFEEFATDIGFSALGGGVLQGGIGALREAHWRRQGKNVYTEVARELGVEIPPETPRTAESAVSDAKAAKGAAPPDMRDIHGEDVGDWRKTWVDSLEPEDRARFVDAGGRITESGEVAIRDAAAVRSVGEANVSRLVALGDDASDAMLEGVAMASRQIDEAPVARQTVEAIADVLARSREEGIPVSRLEGVDEKLRGMASEIQRLGDSPNSIGAVIGRFAELSRGLDTADDASDSFREAIATAWDGATAAAKLERMGDNGQEAVIQAVLDGMTNDRSVSVSAQVDAAAGVGSPAAARAEASRNIDPENYPGRSTAEQVANEIDAHDAKATKEPSTYEETRRQVDNDVSRADKDLADLEEEIERLKEAQTKSSGGAKAVPVKMTRENVVEAVRESLGDVAAKWFDDGRSDVMTLDELRKVAPDAPSDALGVDLRMPDGSRKIVLVGEAMGAKDPARVFLHEVFHFQRENILGEAGWAELRSQVRRMVADIEDAKRGGRVLSEEQAAWQAARDMVPSDTGERLSPLARAELIDEETVAYLIEAAPESTFVRGLVAKVRAWLFEHGFRLELTEDDLRALAVSMVRRPAEARGRGGARFSRLGNRGTFDPTNPDIRFSRSVTPRTLRESLRAAVDKLERAEKLWPAALEKMKEFDVRAFDADDEYAAGLERMAIERMMATDKAITAEDANALLSAWLSTNGDVDKAAGDLLMAQGEIVRRNAISARRTAANFRQIIGAWKPNEIAEGLISLDDASMFLRSRSRLGTFQAQKGRESAYKSFLLAKLGDLQKYAAGVGMNAEQKRARDLEIFRCLRDNITPEGAEAHGIGEASARTADAIRQTFQMMRRRGYDLGEITSELEDWGLTQSHDKTKLQNAAAVLAGKNVGKTVVRAAIARKRGKIPAIGSAENFEAWAAFVVQHFDLDRMGIRVDKTKPVQQWTKKARRALESIYEGSAGLKRRPEDFGVAERDVVPGEIDDPRGVLDAYECMHSRRVIHFKDAASAFSYNEVFGASDLFGAVTSIIEKNARSHGMRYIYGASPETARARLIQMLRDHVGIEGRASGFSKASAWKMNVVHDEVTGRLNDPVNAVAARALATLRAFSGASKLAGTGTTQLMDAIPASISNAFRFRGNALGGSLQMLGRLVGKFDSKERKAAIDNLTIGFNEQVGEILRDQRGDVQSAVAGLYDFTMKIGLVHYLDRTNIRTTASRIAHGFGAAASAPGTMPQTERLLSAYGFEGDADMRVLRESSVVVDGKPFLSPEGLPNVSREALEEYAAAHGLADAKEAADDLEVMIHTLISSEVSMARMAPTARTRAIMKFGTRPGTFTGEVFRSAGQFKSYPAEYARRLWVEWPDALGGKNLLDLPFAGKMRVAGYIATMIAGGLMVQQLKLLQRFQKFMSVGEEEGEDDRVFRFADIPLVNDQTLMRAITQAGVIPIYMDQILGPDATDPSKAVAEAVLGPTIGGIYSTSMSALNVVKSFDPEAQDIDKAVSTVNADLVRAAKGWTPFVGHWAARGAMDRLVWWQLQEMASPGWADKFEARTEMKGGRPYIGMRPMFEVFGQAVQPDLPEWLTKYTTATPTEAVQ